MQLGCEDFSAPVEGFSESCRQQAGNGYEKLGWRMLFGRFMDTQSVAVSYPVIGGFTRLMCIHDRLGKLLVRIGVLHVCSLRLASQRSGNVLMHDHAPMTGRHLAQIPRAFSEARCASHRDHASL